MYIQRQFMNLFMYGVIILIAGCSSGGSETKKTNVRFGIGQNGSGKSALKTGAVKASQIADVTGIVISVEKADGTVVWDTKHCAIYSFPSGGYISETLTIEVGSYRLTKFLAIDATNTVIYAAPDSNAAPELLALVNDPLPIEFSVSEGIIHTQPVEVLSVGSYTPQDFGYTAFTFTINDIAKNAERTYFNSAGTDGIWFTADDEISWYDTQSYRPNGNEFISRTYTGSGSDGIWKTSDDIPVQWYWNRTETSGSIQNSAGPDGLWFSDDDTISTWEKFDQSGTPVQINPQYNAPGDDGTWFTADDIMCGYYKRFLNPNGAETKRIYYNSPGADGIWFTEDDIIGDSGWWFGCYTMSTFNGNNNRWDSWNKRVIYSGPGPDGIWMTADDQVSHYMLHHFGDGTQYWTKEEWYLPGPDGTAFTADDIMSGYRTSDNTY